MSLACFISLNKAKTLHPFGKTKEMKHASDISETYLIIAYQSLLRIFIYIFIVTVFFSLIFFHSAPEEGLYCKPKYRAILFKII